MSSLGINLMENTCRPVVHARSVCKSYSTYLINIPRISFSSSLLVARKPLVVYQRDVGGLEVCLLGRCTQYSFGLDSWRGFLGLIPVLQLQYR